jgi:hypothetical protein
MGKRITSRNYSTTCCSTANIVCCFGTLTSNAYPPERVALYRFTAYSVLLVEHSDRTVRAAAIVP